jgi:hypothetical protein
MFLRVRELYMAPDRKWRNQKLPAWYYYGMGLAHYQLGSHALALQHMRLTLPGPLPPLSRAKALVTLAASSGRLLMRGGEAPHVRGD